MVIRETRRICNFFGRETSGEAYPVADSSSVLITMWSWSGTTGVHIFDEDLDDFFIFVGGAYVWSFLVGDDGGVRPNLDLSSSF